MIIITAPELYTPKPTDHKVFLAGAIDMGAAVDWQSEVVAAMFDEPTIVLYNPRRRNFTSDTLDRQIEWELTALDSADTILMWLPLNSKAPISLFEAGLYWNSGKLIIGAEPGFYRRRNLEITGQRYGVHIYSDLLEVINVVRGRAF